MRGTVPAGDDNESESVRQLAPWERIDDVDVVLANLPRVATAGAQVEVTLTEWVRRGRELGATWERIGDALGMTLPFGDRLRAWPISTLWTLDPEAGGE